MNTFDATIRKSIKKWAVQQTPPAGARKSLLQTAAKDSTLPQRRAESTIPVLPAVFQERILLRKKTASYPQPPEWYHGLVEMGLLFPLTTNTLGLSMIK
jgi:hypothetical protein